MASERLGTLLRGAAERLRGYAALFDRGTRHHNEEAFGALSSVEIPALPEDVADLPVDVPESVRGGDPSSLVLAELEKVSAVGDRIARLERDELYPICQRLAELENEVKDALINQDGKLE